MAKYARKMERVPRPPSSVHGVHAPRSTEVIRHSRRAARAKLIGAHPLHSDTHHAMTGASFLPKSGKPHIPKAPKAPKMPRKPGRAIRKGII